MIEKVNAGLDDDAIRQVWALLLQRYARVACSDVSPWWNGRSGPLTEFLVAIDDDAAWDDGRVARLLSVSEEYLDLLDETPTGELYYPYQALTLVEDCCNGILGEAGRKHSIGLGSGPSASLATWTGRCGVVASTSSPLRRLSDGRRGSGWPTPAYPGMVIANMSY